MEKNPHAGFGFSCPHCLHVYRDEMECLQHNELHEIACESCAEEFLFLLAECLACGEETTFSWRDKSDLPESAELICAHCAKPLRNTEEDENDDGIDS